MGQRGDSSAGVLAETAIWVAGQRLVPDLSGALYWPAEAALIVADLHLEKGSALARRGVFLPPYDSRATLARLARLIDRLIPRLVIALGDSFHDPEGPARLAPEEGRLLRGLAQRHRFVWIAGNHDADAAAVLGGSMAETLSLGPLHFRHEPRAGAAVGEIAGHLHPCASLAVRGRRLRRRCFASDGRRCILPAFGAYTGGLDLSDEAFGPLFSGPLNAWLIGERRVHPVSANRLFPRAA